MKPDPFKEGLAAARRGDFPTAAELWRGLAEKGDARAQYNLGYLYANGRGVSQDYPAALAWYTRAAEQGFAPAQFNLGVLYSSDDGVPPDFPAALQWYRAAAGQGDADAQFNLGIAYALGQGVTQDYVQAYRWYDLAATAGHEKAATTRDSIAAELTPEQIAAAVHAHPTMSEALMEAAHGIDGLPIHL